MCLVFHSLIPVGGIPNQPPTSLLTCYTSTSSMGTPLPLNPIPLTSRCQGGFAQIGSGQLKSAQAKDGSGQVPTCQDVRLCQVRTEIRTGLFLAIVDSCRHTNPNTSYYRCSFGFRDFRVSHRQSLFLVSFEEMSAAFQPPRDDALAPLLNMEEAGFAEE